MRELFVAGNWKMNLDGRAAVALAQMLRERVADVTGVRLAVCPAFVHLKSVADALTGSNIAVGGQNMYTESGGAYTGETSGPMLLDAGCRHVILGHSERRHVLGESDEFIHAKVLKALDLGLEPIVCVGETLEQRRADHTEAVVAGQLKSALEGVAADSMQSITVAYEPVWAIGTGETATPDQAEEVHAVLRGLLEDGFGQAVADAMPIQYGGSVKPANAAELMAMPNVDGALVGGASLKADDFEAIIRAARGVRK
jgi:triosephosphate isomerase